MKPIKNEKKYISKWIHEYQEQVKGSFEWNLAKFRVLIWKSPSSAEMTRHKSAMIGFCSLNPSFMNTNYQRLPVLHESLTKLTYH